MMLRKMTLRQFMIEKRAAAGRKAKRAVKAKTLWGKSDRRKLLVKQLDNLFSLRIRKRDQKHFGRCPFHELTTFRPIECVFHFLTRSKYSVRWDPRNGIGSCFGCNIRYEHDQIFVEFIHEWYKKTWGADAWETLKREGQRVGVSTEEMLKLREQHKTALQTGIL